MKYLFDSSAIFKAIKENKINLLIGNYTLELARYELGNILWKNFPSKKPSQRNWNTRKNNQTNPKPNGNHTNKLQRRRNTGNRKATENHILRRLIRLSSQSKRTTIHNRRPAPNKKGHTLHQSFNTKRHQTTKPKKPHLIPKTKNPQKPKTTAFTIKIRNQTSRTIQKIGGALKSILRQAGLTENDLKNLLEK
ncbi:MAG: hypothetical protein QXJ94_05695 [Candidatus Bathyarchaeia archaeon]